MAGRKFKHGNKRTWELALDAVVELGGKAEAREILARIRRKEPDYVKSNLLADLSTISVNSPSRGQYSQNAEPRRTDSGSEFDRLFKHGIRTSVSYEIYDAKKHGVWEIYLDAAGKARVREVKLALVERALMDAMAAAELQHAFDPTSVEDSRRRLFASIVRRQGQSEFRQTLMRAYQGRCAITGCTVGQILEAAHIHPYRGEHTNAVSNGLLLRADIHTLFDLGLLWFDQNTFTVVISKKLEGTEYADLHGKEPARPVLAADNPSHEALRWHSRQFSD